MEKQQQNLTLMDLDFGGDEGLWKQYHSNCVTHTILATFTSEAPGLQDGSDSPKMHT